MRGISATRKDVINYVANKAAGAHFDPNRKDVYEMLGQCRSAIAFKLVSGAPQFSIDLSKFKPLDENYLPPPNSIDPVFFEFYATCHYISQSPIINELLNILQNELGRGERPTSPFTDGRAMKRQEPAWTPFIKIDATEFVPPNALSAKIQYRLWSNDASVPLMIRFASNEGGSCMTEVSGPSGVVEQVISPQMFYVSLSHPSVAYEVSVLGYSVGNGDW